ncbi:MAG: N-acetylneuraminate synthase [Phycisphaerales bacterium]|nr:N-acetylneuraminate synthase [Phycisphaerales bacterium]
MTSRETVDTSEPNVGPRVCIGDHVIGDGAPVYIVAEAGVNHDGSLDEALELVDAAADAGADAVKFQVFDAARLTTNEVATADYQATTTGQTSQRRMLEGLQLSGSAFAAVADRCRARGIAFLATPFGVEDVARVVEWGAPAIKIASTDLVDFDLLAGAISTDRPLIVSTGAADEQEIAESVAFIAGGGASKRLILLHCVCQYPTPAAAANLGAIRALANRFGVPVGFSDHTVETETGGFAVCAGARLLEKHFTLDRRSPGPDHAMSLEPAELRTYIETAHRACAAMGSGRLGFQPGERIVRQLGRKSLVAARAIAAGEVLTAECLTAKRAGAGVSPTEKERLIGRRAARDIPAGTPMTAGLVQ